MRRRDFLIGGTTALAASPLLGRRAAAAARPESIVVMTWGGQNGEALRNGVDKAYTERTGVKVVQDTGSSPVERITKLKLNLNDQKYDILNVHDGLFPLAIKQGVLEPMNRNSPNMPNLKDVRPGMVHPNWVVCFYSALGLCYNKAIKSPPTSWADLWRPEFKGRIVIPEVVHSIGLYPVVAGAIAQGKSPKDADAGFEMLKRLADLRPIVARDTDTILNALRNEEALIGFLYKSQTFSIQDKGANVQWLYPKEGAIEVSWGYGIAKNTKHREWAEKWIDTAMDPKVQTYATHWANYPGSNPKMLEHLPAKLRERAFFTDDQLARMITLDHEFMSDKRAEWTERWNRVMAS